MPDLSRLVALALVVPLLGCAVDRVAGPTTVNLNAPPQASISTIGLEEASVTTGATDCEFGRVAPVDTLAAVGRAP